MKIGYFVAFSLGAIAGGFACVYALKGKIQADADAQIESVKKTFAEHWSANNPPVPEKKKKEDPNAELKKDIRTVQNFSRYESLARNYGKPETINLSSDEPCVIKPEDFGENEDYPEISYYFFSDGVVTDENFEPITNLDEMIGEDSLECFGMYKDDPDTVYIRNDHLRCYIEILKDHRSYAQDIKPTMPRHLEE